MQLLLIEEERNSADWLAVRLADAGFVTTQASSRAEANRTGVLDSIRAIVIDLATGSQVGRDAVKQLREDGLDQPLLILSPQSNWREKVDCLNNGADDYLVKPLRAEEVTAKLRAMIRRSVGYATDRMTLGEVELDLNSRRAWLAGAPLDLTRGEFRLLRLLMLRRGRFQSHEELHGQLFAHKPDRAHNTVEVQITRLRRKIGKDRIQTLRGVGYRLIAACTKADARADGPKTATLPTHAPESSFESWAPQI